MSFLYILEDIRTPMLDAFFAAITHLGSEILFMAIAIVVFWCSSKKNGYYLLCVGFFGTLLNQFLKLVCRIPRPWVRNPDFTIVEAARADATGYSFPSGHTQSAISTLGCIARTAKRKLISWTSIVLTVLVAFSRMYLGVHTPADVLVALALGTVLIFVLYPICSKSDENPRGLFMIICLLTLLSLAYVVFVEVNPWPADMDAENLSHGIKNGYLMFGSAAAMTVSFFVERKYIRFDVRAPWWAQILKVVVGLALLIGVKEGLKPVVELIFNGHPSGDALRYFCMVIFAVLVWPLTFAWFGRGCKRK